MQKIKCDDEVIVIAGKDKGKRGAVTRILDNGKVLVRGVNIVKKHTKPNPNVGVVGGIVEKEMPIQISNVAIFNGKTNRADRIGFKVLDDGKKVRVFKSSGEQL